MSDEKQGDGNLEFWAILELFGHSKIAGYVRQVSLGGDCLLRVDVPEVTVPAAYHQEKSGPPVLAGFTKFYSPKSVFAMTPVTQETAEAMVRSLRVVPIEPLDLRSCVRALPSPSTTTDGGDA